MKNHRYTEEELDFLRQHAQGRSRAELVGMLKERFGFDANTRRTRCRTADADFSDDEKGLGYEYWR